MYEADLDESLNKRFDGIDKRFDAVDKRLDGLDRSLHAVLTQPDDQKKSERLQNISVIALVFASAAASVLSLLQLILN